MSSVNINMDQDLEFHGTYFNSNGIEVEKDSKDICAKYLTSNRTGNSFYVIKRCNKGLFDPTININSYKKEMWKFIKVNEQKFNLYLDFLQTKQKRFLVQAERII